MNKHFTGGIDFAPSTLELKKRVTLAEKIVTYRPKKVTIPFDQHIGAANEALVKVGDQVLKGQVIANTTEAVSGHVHASISGRVTAIKEVPALNGQTQKAIEITSDTSEKGTSTVKLPANLTVKELVREAGVVGLGGATFPTHIKLAPADHIQVKTIILNGAECEPLIHADDYLMQAESKRILRGAEIARELLEAKEILVGIEADKPQAIAAMTQAATTVANCRVITLPVQYPQGGEKQLLESLIGKESPIAGRSVETGAFTMNVATSLAVAQAVDEHLPLLERLVTVTGDVAKPQVVRFPLGTSAGELIEFAGGMVGKPAKIIHGGPMMGKVITDLATPLTKGSNGLIVLNEMSITEYQESPCIRCNRCVVACPIRLEPQQIEQAYLAEDLYRCWQLKADQCINCGCCTYVCPARRPLAMRINEAKATVSKAVKQNT